MRKSARWWLLLLLLPFAAMLALPWYNRAAPTLAGFPFFYAWLLGWIIATALLTFIVHRRWRA